MNTHYSPPPSHHKSIILGLILLAALSSAGGFLHVYYKNEEIQTMRKIDESDKAIAQLELEIRALEMQADQQLNRYSLKEKLVQQASNLEPIPVGLAITVPSIEPSIHTTAMNP